MSCYKSIILSIRQKLTVFIEINQCCWTRKGCGCYNDKLQARPLKRVIRDFTWTLTSKYQFTNRNTWPDRTCNWVKNTRGKIEIKGVANNYWQTRNTTLLFLYQTVDLLVPLLHPTTQTRTTILNKDSLVKALRTARITPIMLYPRVL